MGKKGRRESNTSCKETFEPLPVEGKSPATVVLLLNSPEEDILAKACEAIHAFAEKGDENKVSLLGLGALEPLCRIITHNNKLVRRNAFMALGTMATNGDVKKALKKLDVIPSITEKLAPDEDTVVHEFATLCLASLSVDCVCKVQIFESKALPALIQLLSSPDPDVAKNSLEIIFNLVQDYQSRMAVQELGGIPPLLDLLKSDFPVIQHLALKTLENITTEIGTRNAFREKQGFEKIMEILKNMDYRDLHVEGLRVVFNCLSDSETVHLIHKDGGLTSLMDFVLTPNAPEIQAGAVKCITRVARDAESFKLLHELVAEKVLVELLSATDVSVKTATCQAVATMSLYSASKYTFRDLGGIPAVVQLLSSDSSMLKEAASQALSNLTHGNQPNVAAVYEAGGHEVLVQMLNSTCPYTVASSAATLCNMGGEEMTRTSILSHGAIPALVEPLKSTDTQTLVNATQCLAVLACDEAARRELHKAGGLHSLVKLLHSCQKKVLDNACSAVSVCGSDEPSAVEMCNLGALEILQDINQSVNRRSSFSELAMTRLLNSNLPVKYSLTGHLASTDIIRGVFYDTGQVRAGQRILSFEELSKEAVNQKRPIILINLATEKKEKEEQQTNEPESLTEKTCKIKDDIALQTLMEETKKSILPLINEEEKYATLARLVSKAMGGAVELEKLHEFPWVLHLSELKFLLQSNVVPIGLIDKGIYCHRALLFKCLADSIGMSCTLCRGEYNRAWNEILLCNWNESRNQPSSQPRRFIVDLMHQPGSLLAVNSPAALQYQTI